jgi:NAD(P)-dependent dehydrogenase (short-subunit alcohol dehydrogenase family)
MAAPRKEELEGRVALVTGSGIGPGEGVAKRLAEAGCERRKRPGASGSWAGAIGVKSVAELTEKGWDFVNNLKKAFFSVAEPSRSP